MPVEPSFLCGPYGGVSTLDVRQGFPKFRLPGGPELTARATSRPIYLPGLWGVTGGEAEERGRDAQSVESCRARSRCIPEGSRAPGQTYLWKSRWPRPPGAQSGQRTRSHASGCPGRGSRPENPPLPPSQEAVASSGAGPGPIPILGSRWREQHRGRASLGRSSLGKCLHCPAEKHRLRAWPLLEETLTPLPLLFQPFVPALRRGAGP